MNDLCELDMTRVLDFLHRVGVALNARLGADKQTPDLNYLAGAWHGPENDGMIDALAKEWHTPFVSETVEGTFTGSMREAYFAMIDADKEGKVPFHYRTFAYEESEHWTLTDTPLAKYAPFPIFGLYVVSEEGDPNGTFLENIFCYPDLPDDAPKNRYGQNEIEAFSDTMKGSEMQRSGEDWHNIRQDAPEKMDADPRYSERFTFDADAMDLTFTPDVMDALADKHSIWYVQNARAAILDNLAKEPDESAVEYFSGNQICPKVVLSAIGVDN